MYFSSQTLHIFYKQITFFLLANLIIEMISTPKKYKRMVEMDILSIIALLGGLAFFLFGMNIMGEGLEKVGGGKLEKTLEKLTSGVFRGVLLGAAVTAVIQSSSATTVMVVGFVNSGIMKLSQAVGVIMGANIGTTVTAWLLSLTGIEGDGLLMQMLKPSTFAPLFAFIAIAITMFSKKQKTKDICSIVIGFAILMSGMETMSAAVKPLANAPWFSQMFLMFAGNPILGILAGAILTAIIQSSSASVGILQALSATGAISFGGAFPIILGQNIGTCATALISCIGAKKNAKRAAFIHLYFNIVGVVAISLLFYGLNAIFNFDFVNGTITRTGIAIVHTSFNFVATLILLPFNKLLVKLATLTIKEDKPTGDAPFLDERFLNTPAIATERSMRLTAEMAEISKNIMFKAFSCIKHFDPQKEADILSGEKKADQYEDILGTYLVKLSAKSLSANDSNIVAGMLHSIRDLERISDHAVSVLKVAKELHDKKVSFSPEAQEELEHLIAATKEILSTTVIALNKRDLILAQDIEPLEQTIDDIKAKMKKHHIKRLQNGECTIELGFIFSDLLSSIERVSDLCANVAAYMIEVADDRLETHIYSHDVRKNGDNYRQKYESYRQKYLKM